MIDQDFEKEKVSGGQKGKIENDEILLQFQKMIQL